MKRALARVLQVAVLVLGVAVLAFLLWEPHLEGRNAHATVSQVYFHDPFLAFAYLGSIAFFAALFRAFTLLGQVAGQGGIPPSAPANLRFIRNCAFVLIGFVVVGEVFIFLHESDDRAGCVFMGLLVALGSVGVALAAAKLERSLVPGP